MRQVPINLANLAESLGPGDHIDVTVRELLAWHDAQRRGWLILAWIRSNLRLLGLSIDPDPSEPWIDSTVRISRPAEENSTALEQDSGSQTSREEGTPTVELDNESAESRVRYSDPTKRVGQLPSANRQVESVDPDSSIQAATTRMLLRDFSQLAVLNGRTCKGVISWKSLGLSIASGRSPTHVRDCMEQPHVVDSNQSLFSALPVIVDHDYVLVRSREQTIQGIVTAADIVVEFREQSEAFLILGDIEQQLRILIDAKFTIDEIRAAKIGEDDRDIDSVDDLTFGEYQNLVGNSENWAKINCTFDRSEVIRKLDEVRNIRNDVAHFSPDPIPTTDIDTLRHFSEFMNLLNASVLPQ